MRGFEEKLPLREKCPNTEFFLLEVHSMEHSMDCSDREHSMPQTFVKPLVIFFFINFQRIIIKKILVYTGTMD